MKSTITERDPVALAVESLLQFMETEGLGSFVCLETSSGCSVSFRDIYISAGTRDIALVRMASEMMNHPEYEGWLKKALRQPLKDGGYTSGS